MSRRVPEVAIVVGVLLSLTWLVFPPLVGEYELLTEPVPFLGYVTVAVALCYPFAAYTCWRAEDPDDTLLPRPILAVAAVIGAGCAVVGAVGGAPLLGLVVGLLVVVPPAAYALAYHAISPPPQPTLAAGAALAVAAVTAGLVVGQPYRAGLVAVLAFVPALAAFDRLAGNRLPAQVVIGGTALATLVVSGVALALASPLAHMLAAGLTVAFGGLIAVRIVGEKGRSVV
ncbi:hypothetical protein [Haloarchaeobius sp. DFWS5]|uniref:hypothetical protein n=1 Tax=Haloarchaeobius sp. DFWS5 TaxID=3446114 RepID=UPI003EB849A6